MVMKGDFVMLYYDYEWMYNKHIPKEDAGLREFNKLEQRWVKKKENKRSSFTLYSFVRK